MPKRDWEIGSFVHVYNEGVRGLPIVKEEADRRRFVRMLYYLNDANQPGHWERQARRHKDGFHFQRPDSWRERKPLVDISAYCLQKDHYHILLRERQAGGIASFMQRINSSMANHFNTKYGQSGLLAGPYKSREVSSAHLPAVFFFINLHNPLETYPGGYDAGRREFEKGFQHALEYLYCGLFDYVQGRWPIIEREHIRSYVPTDQVQPMARKYILEKKVFDDPDPNLKQVLIDY